MYWTLVSRGVVSGLCLVLAKYWYDKREEKQQDRAPFRNGPAESASGHPMRPRALAATIDISMAPSATRAAAVTNTVASSEGITDSRTAEDTRVDAGPAAVETASVDASDAATQEHRRPGPDAVPEPSRKTKPENKDDEQRVEEALASGALSAMDTLLDDISDPVLRNRLLKRLVNGYYRRRSDAMHRAAFYRIALLQMEEASSILDGIEETGEPRPNYLEAFKTMAIALDEDGSPDGAIAVCEMALSLGLQDGTKTGFEGRIIRLKRCQMPSGTARPEKLLH